MTEYLDRYPTMHEYAEGKRINPKLTDLISRADAIDAVVNAHPMAEVVKGSSKQVFWVRVSDVAKALKALPSADADPKWNCTASFVAEQLERLKEMTDEERWDFFIRFFSPSADAVHGEWIYDHHNDEHTCSVCGRKALCDDYVGVDWQMEVLSDYCPSCGARMKGGAE